MAIYEFKCEKCGAEFEKMTSRALAEKPGEVKCPECGTDEVKKLVSLARSIKNLFCAPSG